MNDEEFNKHKETIEIFIIEELILRVPGLINFTIHRLPKILEKDTEYIFSFLIWVKNRKMLWANLFTLNCLNIMTVMMGIMIL